MELIQRYEGEMALVRGPAAWIGVGLLTAVLVTLPFLLRSYQVNVLNFKGINSIAMI